MKRFPFQVLSMYVPSKLHAYIDTSVSLLVLTWSGMVSCPVPISSAGQSQRAAEALMAIAISTERCYQLNVSTLGKITNSASLGRSGLNFSLQNTVFEQRVCCDGV